MKPATSILIQDFLGEVRRGKIGPTDGSGWDDTGLFYIERRIEGSSAPRTFNKMVVALCEILAGAKTADDAMGIERSPCQPSRIEQVLPTVHALRKQGMTFPAIAKHVNVVDHKKLAKKYRARKMDFDAIDLLRANIGRKVQITLPLERG